MTAEPAADAALPLQGIRVLDLSRVLAGPYCAMLLSMLGAEVIKVEDAKGDESRTWPPHDRDMGSNFLGMNLNKRSIVIDLKAPEGQALVRELAAKSDVLVENFKVGTMARFGLDYEALKTLNPRLVYTAISAFGPQGPKATDPGYEALVQAFTGVMDITGHPDGEPARCGVSFLDMSTGVMAAFATVSALYQREHTGQGGIVTASLMQSALGLMTPIVSNFFQHGTQPVRVGTSHPNVVPYQAFTCADGRIFIAAANQNLFERFCRALAAEALIADPRFKDNPTRVRHKAELIALLEEHTRQHPQADLMERLMAAGVPCAPINSVGAFLQDPQLAALEALVELEDPDYGKLRLANLPFRVNGRLGQVRARAPRLGEHTDAVLADLGYDAERIAALRGAGVVQGG